MVLPPIVERVWALELSPGVVTQPPPNASPSARPPLLLSTTLPQQPLPTAAYTTTRVMLSIAEAVLTFIASPKSASRPARFLLRKSSPPRPAGALKDSGPASTLKPPPHL